MFSSYEFFIGFSCTDNFGHSLHLNVFNFSDFFDILKKLNVSQFFLLFMVAEKFAFMAKIQFQPTLMGFGHLSSEARWHP